jgi:hypothetical protein
MIKDSLLIVWSRNEMRTAKVMARNSVVREAEVMIE